MEKLFYKYKIANLPDDPLTKKKYQNVSLIIDFLNFTIFSIAMLVQQTVRMRARKRLMLMAMIPTINLLVTDEIIKQVSCGQCMYM